MQMLAGEITISNTAIYTLQTDLNARKVKTCESGN